MKVAYVPRCAKTVQETFFSVRVCNSWNSLPQQVIEAQSTNSFKNRLAYRYPTASLNLQGLTDGTAQPQKIK